jgi:hypothetical protein
MLAFLLAQVASGLVADDEIANVGPLNRFVTSATAHAATAWHKQIGQGVIIALVLLHIGAIVYYLVKKKTNLIAPMISGDKPLPADVAAAVPADVPAARDDAGSRILALVLAALAAVGVALVVRLGGQGG